MECTIEVPQKGTKFVFRGVQVSEKRVAVLPLNPVACESLELSGDFEEEGSHLFWLGSRSSESTQLCLPLPQFTFNVVDDSGYVLPDVVVQNFAQLFAKVRNSAIFRGDRAPVCVLEE